LSQFVASFFIPYFIKVISLLGIKLTAHNLPENLSKEEKFHVQKIKVFFIFFPKHSAENGMNFCNVNF